MARFLSLNSVRATGYKLGLLLAGPIFLISPLRAQVPMVPAGATPASTNVKPPSALTTAPIPDTFNRYGKIWAPSDDVAHPIKLNVQFPGVGEMKIPSQDELSVRDKLEQLATLSDADIRAQLEQWPPYGKMKLADEGQMLIRIQQFKDQRTNIAMARAHDLGLLTLTPDQKVRFEKEYWDKRLQMDHQLSKQFEPILKARQQKMLEELYREFSPISTAGPPPPAPKPPAPTALAQAKPAPPPASPGAPSAPPVAQGTLH